MTSNQEMSELLSVCPDMRYDSRPKLHFQQNKLHNYTTFNYITINKSFTSFQKFIQTTLKLHWNYTETTLRDGYLAWREALCPSKKHLCESKTAYLHQGNSILAPREQHAFTPQRGRSHGGNGFSAPCRKISCAVQENFLRRANYRSQATSLEAVHTHPM